MILISALIMLVLLIVAGATQFWLLAMIGAGIFVATVLMYFMATNDVFGAIVIVLAAIAAPILYLVFAQDWILYISYIAIGLWVNSGAITNNDVYSYWTIEGKVYRYFEEEATEFLINLFSFVYAAIWGGLAFIGTQFHWFLIIPSAYLIVRSVIIIVQSSNYTLSHSFMLFEDIGNFFRSFGYGVKSFFSGARMSQRKFSWWNLFVPLLLVALSVGLVYLESSNTYSNFAKTLADGNLFSSTQWFHLTKSIWEWIPELCEQVSDAIPFFGDILNLPLYLVLLILNLLVAILEAIVSLVWLLVCLVVDELLPFLVGALLLYVIPVLLPVLLLVLLILSFTRDHSLFNRILTVLTLLLGIIGCYYYFVYMSGAAPLVPLPF